jgi:hypothetical protein
MFIDDVQESYYMVYYILKDKIMYNAHLDDVKYQHHLFLYAMFLL